MATNKDLAIEVLDNEFRAMAEMVMDQLAMLEKIILSNDKVEIHEMAKTLKKREEEIDKYEIFLDNKIIQAIVLYKPVASNLRHIFSIYRMMVNLERIGDLIIKIYYFSQELKEKDIVDKPTQYLLNMLGIATDMVRESILSFTNENVDDAINTIKEDRRIDKLNQKILKKTLTNLNIPKDSQELIYNFVDIRSMVSAIERIGDHATNIAEASIYAITGTNIAHKDVDKIKNL